MISDRPALQRPSPELLEQFRDIVGPAYAVTDPQAQSPYVTEWRDRYHGVTPVVLRPGTVDEVCKIMQLAHTACVGVVPQAGNTGLVGGQIPSSDGDQVVLSVERLNKVRSIDPAGGHIIVEGGATLADVQRAVGETGWMFPLSMASEGSARIAGAIATNAGGVHVLAHGTMRALTLGLEVVLADGRVWNGLRVLRKDNTGYALKDLFAGSEGTLGIITAAALKLAKQPAGRSTAFIALASLDDVHALFAHTEAAASGEVSAFEFISQQALRFVERHIPGVRPPLGTNHAWYVLLELSSQRDAAAAEVLLQSVLTARDAVELVQNAAVAQSLSQAADFWRLRDAISEAQKYEGGSIKHDISVPPARIAEFIARADQIVARLCAGARPCPFGHFGDGNIHYNVSQPEGIAKPEFLLRWGEMQDAVHALVSDMGGSISAEHGIGVMKRDALRQARSPVELEMMRAIKRALDPRGILNPGKLI